MKYALAVRLPFDADPAADAIDMSACEDGLHSIWLIGDGLGEECAGLRWIYEVRALALVTWLEVRELTCLVAILGRPGTHSKRQ